MRLFEEIGQIYPDKLDNLPQAIAAYQAALALDPDAAADAAQAAGAAHGAQAVGVRRPTRWCGSPSWRRRPRVRAKYLYTAALIRRDELDDVEGAVALLNRALDEAPG